MNTDIMLDFETLALGTQPAILTIGAARFNPLGNELDESIDPEMECLYIRVDLDSCIALGLEVNDSTVEWWGKQSPEAQAEALGDGDRVSIEESFDRLYKFCFGAQRVWGNGSIADVAWAETIYRKLGRSAPWKFWQVRDCRTAFDLGLNPSMPAVAEHHALKDAVNQAIGIQAVYRQLAQCQQANGQTVVPFTDFKKR